MILLNSRNLYFGIRFSFWHNKTSEYQISRGRGICSVVRCNNMYNKISKKTAINIGYFSLENPCKIQSTNICIFFQMNSVPFWIENKFCSFNFSYFLFIFFIKVCTGPEISRPRNSSEPAFSYVQHFLFDGDILRIYSRFISV